MTPKQLREWADHAERYLQAGCPADAPEPVGNPDQLRAHAAALEELAKLRARLEIDPRHSYDGIAARDETILRALRLRAAAEANDGTTPETDAVLPYGSSLNPDVPHIALELAGLARCLERERNWLAARVGELEPDAERYRWLREPQDHICVDVEEENEDGWTGTFYALVRDDLDAAIDAARGSKP